MYVLGFEPTQPQVYSRPLQQIKLLDQNPLKSRSKSVIDVTSDR